ncbi:hypothetical protein HELRODRAFT_163898 [Helobdella robusta]|uniref:Uncharacterized protein n=1 Tax=Helobdella robusta TaxID=6412 RepID=T1EUL3_HELRO|nr:hypothetical protein HELRODRAFT_163898 [Helobdella robusta]ESN96775.1 hypothetical protein HELRODRAFT_163898 [Helobdella robusta]
MSPKCAKFLGSTNVKDKDSVLRCSRCDILSYMGLKWFCDSCVKLPFNLDSLSKSVDASKQDILDKIDSNKNEMITKLEKLDEVNAQLENAKIKNSIMRNVYKMKTIADKFAGVELSDDLTKEQRQEYKTFVEKAKSMQSDDKENFVYRVRGPVGRWKIIVSKKVHLNNCLSKNKVIKDLATEATKNKCNILLGLLNITSVNSV